jgi:DNA-binding response OmpR family regulator
VSTAPSILIVEDEYGLAEMLSEMLSEVGHEVTLAINGQLALDVLRERRIDLVLADAMMPVMDGPELALAMRSNDMYRQIPIVMMTSLPSAMPRMRGLYDAVLSKPFTPEALLKVLDACTKRGTGSSGAVRPRL